MAHGVAFAVRSRPLALVAIAAAFFALLALPGCDEDLPKDPKDSIPVLIAGRTFKLEPALDMATRTKGLGGRASLPADGGMLFVFPTSQVLAFVMRDCVMDIDVAFLDPAGRVVALHEMKVEEPRRQGETAEQYENRLKRYSSRFSSQFVIELPAGSLKALGVKAGDLIELDTAALKKRAQ
jgi:uncharacterized membrane protein (UPF0127 family)